MIGEETLLVQLVQLVDRVPEPLPLARGRGRPLLYPERLFLKALLIMVVRRLHKVHELFSVLQEPTAEMEQLRSLLSEGPFPQPPHLRATPRLPARAPAGPDRCAGGSPGALAPDLG